MLESMQWNADGKVVCVESRLRFTSDLPNALRRRMEQMEMIQRSLAGYCHAVSIMLQIPGGAAFEPDPDERADVHHLNWQRDPAWPLTVLKTTLTALKAPQAMPAMFGADYSVDFPRDATNKLKKMTRNGLLNVVAECLDRLLFVPFWQAEATLMEVDAPAENSWWDRPEARLAAAAEPEAEPIRLVTADQEK